MKWIETRPAPASVRWLVKHLLRTTGVGVLFGAPGAGKTAESINLACHVATAKPWRNHRVAPGLVVYVAGEDPDGVCLGLQAWEQHHESESPTSVEVVAGPINLMPDRQGQLSPALDELIALIKTIAKKRKQPVALVVIDTLASVWIDETNAGMADFLAHCRCIAHQIDCAVLAVHHTGKDATKGERGGSALRGGADLSLECERSGAVGAITALKVRGGRDGMRWGFTLDVVELGADADGDPITATVAAPTVAPTIAGRLTPRRKTVLRALCTLEAIRANGASTTWQEWREQAYQSLPPDSKNKRRDFGVAAEWLCANGWVDHLDGHVAISPNIAIPPDVYRTFTDVAFAAG